MKKLTPRRSPIRGAALPGRGFEGVSFAEKTGRSFGPSVLEESVGQSFSFDGPKPQNLTGGRLLPVGWQPRGRRLGQSAAFRFGDDDVEFEFVRSQFGPRG